MMFSGYSAVGSVPGLGPGGRVFESRCPDIRAFSSAGSEHLPYKQRVGGSNPSTPPSISFMTVTTFCCDCLFSF